jgi:hypothetical protein
MEPGFYIVQAPLQNMQSFLSIWSELEIMNIIC